MTRREFFSATSAVVVAAALPVDAYLSNARKIAPRSPDATGCYCTENMICGWQGHDPWPPSQWECVT